MAALEVELTSLKQFVDMAGRYATTNCSSSQHALTKRHAYIAFKNIIEER